MTTKETEYICLRHYQIKKEDYNVLSCVEKKPSFEGKLLLDTLKEDSHGCKSNSTLGVVAVLRLARSAKVSSSKPFLFYLTEVREA